MSSMGVIGTSTSMLRIFFNGTPPGRFWTCPIGRLADQRSGPFMALRSNF